jgi:hypothetical protein
MSVAGEPWCVGVGTGRDKDGHDLMRIARWPGQSAKRWSKVREPALSPSFTILTRASPGCLMLRI